LYSAFDEEEVIYPLSESALSKLPPRLQLHMREMHDERALRLQMQVPPVGMSDIMSYPLPRDPSQRIFASRYPPVSPGEQSPRRPLLRHNRPNNSTGHEFNVLPSPIATRDEGFGPTSPTNPCNLQPTLPSGRLLSAPLGHHDNIIQTTRDFSGSPPTESSRLWMHRNVPISQGYTVRGRNGQFDASTLSPGTSASRTDINQFNFGFPKPGPAPIIQSMQTRPMTDMPGADASRGLDLISEYIHPALRAETIGKWQRDGLLPKTLPTASVPAVATPLLPATVVQTPILRARAFPTLVIPVSVAPAPVSIPQVPVNTPRRTILEPYEPWFYPNHGRGLTSLNNDELEERRMSTQRSAAQGTLRGSPAASATPVTSTPVTPIYLVPHTPVALVNPLRRIRPYSPTGSTSEEPVTPPFCPVQYSGSGSSGFFGQMDDSPTDNIVRALPFTPPHQLSSSSTQEATRGSQITSPQRQMLPSLSPSGLSPRASRSHSLQTMEAIMGPDEETKDAWTPEMHAIISDPTRSRQERRNAFSPEHNARNRSTHTARSSTTDLKAIEMPGLGILTRCEATAPFESEGRGFDRLFARFHMRDSLRRLSPWLRRK
jgi:hypothetical protein